jgi:DNA-binding MarR family transcriptional regulator
MPPKQRFLGEYVLSLSRVRYLASRIFLAREIFLIFGKMAQDWTDELLDRWTAVRPRQEMEPYEVTARISRIGLHIARRQEEAFGRFGLNRGEVGVLAALRLAGAKQQLSPTQLFKGLMLSSAGITSRLDGLERRGYVRRRRDPDDRRGVLVDLTDTGREVLDQAVRANAGREKAVLASLTKQEQKALAGLLKKLLAGLETNAVDGPG